MGLKSWIYWRRNMDNEDLYWDDINDYEQIPCWDKNGELPDDDDYKEPSVCDDCEIGDGWECQFCCSKCYEDYGECPNPDCDPMDI